MCVPYVGSKVDANTKKLDNYLRVRCHFLGASEKCRHLKAAGFPQTQAAFCLSTVTFYEDLARESSAVFAQTTRSYKFSLNLLK